MQEDQQKQLTDMKENIGYYQKKAQELEVRRNWSYFCRYAMQASSRKNCRPRKKTLESDFRWLKLNLETYIRAKKTSGFYWLKLNLETIFEYEKTHELLVLKP